MVRNKLTAFIEIARHAPPRRPVEERVKDWKEVYIDLPDDVVQVQAARCMDCGVPFCHRGCPLGNLIPEWNDLVYRNHWKEAIERLHATNPFPEFTGKLCPAPCEDSCVLSINSDPVTIKQVEWKIIDHAWREGWIKPNPPTIRTGKKVAIVGSGPAGLAAAQRLNQSGHWVTVFERDDRIGGLIRYGIPEFKMDTAILNRRLNLLEQEGIVFKPNVNVGVDITADELLREFDAVILAIGATKPKDIHVPGRNLKGIHFAMEYLTMQNRRCEGDYIPDSEFISAEGKNVVIIGGGDTGADCLGTAHRQRAKSVTQFQLWAPPPKERAPNNPWPELPYVFTVSAAHEEGGTREFCVSTKEFLGDENGHVRAIRAARIEVEYDEHGRRRAKEIPGSEFEMPADLVLLAMGYAGPETEGIVSQLGLELTERGNIATDSQKMTKIPGVFAAGDARIGQSLIVWALQEGRDVAKFVDLYLMENQKDSGQEKNCAA